LVRIQVSFLRLSIYSFSYILIATQGSDVLLARTGSGRTTYRTSASDARNISLEDVGIFLNAIEADGGTAGGRSRWGKCLARIPHQVIIFKRNRRRVYLRVFIV